MSALLRLALLNLTRRRLRSLITAAGIAVAVAALFSLLSFHRGYQAGLQGELDRLGAHVLVVPKGCPYDAASIALHGASWPCYLKSAYLQTVRKTPHVAAAAPVFMSAVYDSRSGAQTVYCGVEPDILQVKRLWRLDGRFPSRGELLAGAEAARAGGWRIGEEIALPGIEGGRARVSGILKPTQGADDLFLFLPLADSQRHFKRPAELTHILVRLDAPERMDEAVNALRGCDAGLEMNVVPLAHLFRTIQTLAQSTRLLLGCVALVALLAAAAGLSNTVLMAVMERTREIGVLRAVGAPASVVFSLIWLETLALCAAGSAVGLLAAGIGARAVEEWLRARLPFAPHGDLIHVEPSVVIFCAAVALVTGTIAGLIPAWRASRLAPAEAIRSGGCA